MKRPGAGLGRPTSERGWGGRVVVASRRSTGGWWWWEGGPRLGAALTALGHVWYRSRHVQIALSEPPMIEGGGGMAGRGPAPRRGAGARMVPNPPCPTKSRYLNRRLPAASCLSSARVKPQRHSLCGQTKALRQSKVNHGARRACGREGRRGDGGGQRLRQVPVPAPQGLQARLCSRLWSWAYFMVVDEPHGQPRRRNAA